MTIDPDLLHIQRKRHREKRCLACGIPTPRASLCVGCRATLRYCPRCERVYPKAEANQETPYPTVYCRGCSAGIQLAQRRRGGAAPMEAYRAAIRARTQPMIDRMIALYRAGRTYGEIARAMDLSPGTVRGTIARAQRTGRWPKGLTRQPRRKH